MKNNMIKAGVGRAVITPPRGVYLIGYAERGKGNTGVHDDLYATALALSDGSKTAVLVACDLLCMNEFTVDRIRAAAGNGIDIFISCSHTHSGPVTYSSRHSPKAYGGYLDILVERVSGAVRTACASLAPAVLEFVSTETDIAVNRREKTPVGKTIIGWNRNGPADRSVQTLLVSREGGEPLAAVIDYACHGTVLPPENLLVSSDWIGSMRKRVEAETGTTVLYLQGATADLNPDYEWGEGDPWEAAEVLGSRVAESVIAALNGGREEIEIGPVVVSRSEEWMPLESHADGHGPSKVYRAEVMKFAGLPGWLGFATDFLLDRRYPWKSRLGAREGVWKVPVRVAALRVGNLAIAGLGAEVFTEIGIKVKAGSPAVHTMFASLTDGCIGYLPTDAAHDEGGYEVAQAPYLYRYPARFAKGCEALAVKALTSELKSLYG